MSPATGGDQPDINRVEELVDRLLDEGRDDDLERELQNLDPIGLDAHERETWHHLFGVAAFQRGERAEALERFLAGAEACPSASTIRFSLAQELQHVGRAEEAFSHFDACDFATLPSAYTLMASRYAYLWGEFARGIRYLDPVVAAYDSLRIVDDHFLHMRGLPFFGDTWGTLGALHEAGDTLDAFFAYTERAAGELGDYDFAALERFTSALRTGDFLPVLEALDARIARDAESGWATGHAAMRRAVICATTTAATEPHEILDRVVLGEGDFPWLEDIRTLAHAAVARRESDTARERECVGAFRANQPLLFEPHHVFGFRLLEYQETLRPAYQADCGP